MSAETIIVALLTGGLTVAAGAVVQVIRVVRSGTSASRRSDIQVLREQARDAMARARTAGDDAEFWRYYCGTYAGQLAHAGILPMPDYPTLVPPSEQRRRAHDNDDGQRTRPRAVPRHGWHRREDRGDDRAEG
jgi:hypothetical protein